MNLRFFMSVVGISDKYMGRAMKSSILLMLVCTTALTGCGRSVTSTPGDAPNLEQFVAQIKAEKPTEKREPLPLLLNQEVFSYTDHTTVTLNPNPQSAVDRAAAQDSGAADAAAAQNSAEGDSVDASAPVSNPTPMVENTPLRSPFDYPFVQTPVGNLRPDSNRPKQALESYTLDSLIMVGTMGGPNSLIALVQSPDKVVYRVSPGQYMGQSDGKIIGITPTEIKLIELVADGAGGWIEQPAAIVLKE